jgi:tryptophan 2,3-dioxygenase
MYHQVNELIFKMILWEMKQISYCENIETVFFTERLMRISRYFDMLTTSFSIMEDGMEVDQYMKFRNTLTPASGFQSAQYRLIEFSSTDQLTIGSETPSIEAPYEHAFEYLYWQAAGKDHATGKSHTC